MRIRWRNFSKGVFASGSREAVEPGYARRLKGFAGSVSGDYLRLRYKHDGRLITEAGQTVHSIGRLGTQLYYGAGRGFGFGAPSAPGAVPVVGTNIFANLSNFLNGDRLTFVTGKPVSGKGLTDFIYCCGGGLVFKTRSGVTGFSRWGLPAPTAAITGNEIGPIAGATFKRPPLFNFDTLTGWTGTNASLTLIQDNFNVPGAAVQFGNSLNVTVGSDKTGKAFGLFSPLENFAQFGTGFASVDQDWIVIDVKVVNIVNLDSIQFLFYNDPSGNNQSALTFTVVADDALQRDLTSGANGLGDIPEVIDDEEGFVANPPTSSSGTSHDLVERMAILKLAGTDATWTRLKIPKSAFTYSQPTTIGTTSAWSQITAFEAVITTNKNTQNGGGVSVRLNNGAMFGGAGMQGRYKYCYTLKDSATGHRSNPSPITTIDTIFRSGVQLSVPLAPTNDPEVAAQTNLLLSSSGQVLIREVWRTFGNGSVFFKHAELTQNIGTSGLQTTSVSDKTADWQGLYDAPIEASLFVGNTFFSRGILGKEALTFDNIAPGHAFSDAFGLAFGRMWWTRNTATSGDQAGGQGRVYYSPAGRIESVAGFIDVAGQTGDSMQKGIIWNGIYVFSARRCYEIVGTSEPFQSREILGVPGTLWPHTVVATPYGIVYESLDGIRVFDGSGSQLLPLPPVEVFFRRDTNALAEAGLTVYQTNFNHYACFWQDEYRWSDGVTALAFNLRTGAWRVMDAPPTSWFPDPNGIECFAGGTAIIKSWEFGSTGANFDGSAFAYDFETPGALVDGRATFLVQRVYLDVMIPGGSSMLVTLVKGDGSPGGTGTTQSLGFINGAGVRQLVELNAACAYVSGASVRLSGTCPTTGGLRIHGVELDVHIPEEPGMGT